MMLSKMDFNAHIVQLMSNLYCTQEAKIANCESNLFNTVVEIDKVGDGYILRVFNYTNLERSVPPITVATGRKSVSK